jgi:DNA-nicking Smr family endonuclease
MGKQRFPPPGGEPDASIDEMFRAAVQDVKPLLQTPQASGLAKPKPRARIRKAALDAAEHLDLLMPLQAVSPPDAAAAALSYQRSGVRSQVMRRLKRGLYPTEDELDLHGLTQTAARDRLVEFLARSRDGGRRCVRIIHGKGYRSGARGPVLKTAVDLWLRRHTDVMAFSSARAIDGGTGAVYVLLRG